MEIKVCGPGCPKCHETERIVNEALGEAGIGIIVQKISDFSEIAKLGVFATPAVVIDGKIKCTGKVPSKKDVLSWLK
ncbi:MAG: TM0996/MTH895 family glutaredoxin-like protein [Proteobacteria bacterium]|nr:TM0996/MTH895 family glutaredoxin-like protein [Pseudomonadota bacterium]MBU4298324.1 TM0996/MTH895 family glutaredoxin-like protein [Pseudomonadota bacterium]MCG2748898.1 thioredoxin family protein [Desulfobulbaceae bacterium]